MAHNPDIPRNRTRTLLWLESALLMAVVLWLYRQTPSFEFSCMDDSAMVYNNPHIRSLSLHSLWAMLVDAPMSNWVPLTYLTFALEHQAVGFQPWLYHLTNNLLHALNGVVIVFLFYRLLGIAFAGRSIGGNRLAWGAGVGALLFVIHPLRVESVAWITERKDLLFMIFYSLGLLAYLKYRETEDGRPMDSRFLRNRWWWLVLGSFVLSGLSKGMAVSFPLALLILDYWMGRKDWVGAVREKMPFFACSALIALMTIIVAKSGIVSFLEVVPVQERILRAFYALGFYFEKTLVPVGLTPMYVIDRAGQGNGYLMISAVATFLLLCVGLWWGNRSVRASIVFFGLTALPILGLFQLGIQETADRFTYLPTLWIYLWLAAGIVWCLGSQVNRLAQAGILTAVALYFCWMLMLTGRLIPIWKNPYTMWDHQIRVLPQSYFYIFAGDHAMSRGEFRTGLDYYLGAVRFNPKDQMAYLKVSVTLIQLGKTDEARPFLEKCLTLNPRNATALWMLSAMEGDPSRQERLFRQAVALDPGLWHNPHPVREKIRQEALRSRKPR
ncbi:MAG: hypothetical protein SFY92_09445 [Verrucomicrobiae bacterium]|nr:hypothetical protein [Verrucomicrobiae bacterium]